MNKTCPGRLLTTLFILLTLVLPLAAHEKGDSVFTFRFYSQKDMFYSPSLNNGKELKRMYAFVDSHKKVIASRRLKVFVNGYCNSQRTKAANLAIAKVRSNRVKSELLTNKGLVESNFIIRNHSRRSNFVIVSFVVPGKNVRSSKDIDHEQSYSGTLSDQDSIAQSDYGLDTADKFDLYQPDENQVDSVTTVIEIFDVNDTPKKEVVEIGSATESESYALISKELISDDFQSGGYSLPEIKVEKTDSRVALKTNLLYYAVLMPNIEVEWMFRDRWSAALEWQGAWYAKNDPHKVYRLSTVIPEVRFWVIDKKRWHGMYVGIFGGGGLYDLCNGDKGHEGEGGMVGASVGYMWPISKHFSLDAGIGVGYMRLHDKQYLPQNGHFLYQLTRNINYFGPLRLKLSLTWRLQSKKTQSVK